METPWRETPVLYGEDARRFEERMKHPKPVSKETLERIELAYEIFKKNVKNQ
ncbi:MAG: hypothetical protein LBO74_11825 [Candidatus Symbiothrix sp.]|jgi:hypothetical protein|nr:hypothetical protein [Candidatus Symbiothrix sp.]